VADLGNGLEKDYELSPDGVNGKIALIYIGILEGVSKIAEPSPERENGSRHQPWRYGSDHVQPGGEWRVAYGYGFCYRGFDPAPGRLYWKGEWDEIEAKTENRQR